MAEYTTEVRSICEFYAGLRESKGQNDVMNIIERSRGSIFDFSYPIFDPSYKAVLETKILSHYYTREIGEETVGLWKHRLNSKLNEIMPYYNKLYESEAMKIDPLTNIFKKIEGNKNGTENGEDTRIIDAQIDGTKSTHESGNVIDSKVKHDNGSSGSTTTNNEDNHNTESYDNYHEELDHTDKYSDTPQSQVTGLDNGYLTNVRDVHDDKTNTGKIKNDSTISATGSVSSHESKQTDETNSTNNTTVASETDKERRSTIDTNKNNATTTDEYVEQISGYEGISANKLLKEYRDNILNIDLMIINDLGELFFTLW